VENDKVFISGPSIESAGGQLLAITDYYIWRGGQLWDKFWAQLDTGVEIIRPRRRLLWDVRTGQEIASWGRYSMGNLQQEELWGADLQHARTIKRMFVLSLSPTGKYVAEGGSGSVSVYAVQP
jgi:hypothetical protein